MGKGTKVVAHKGTGLGTGIFHKCGYGDGYYSTLPIGYPTHWVPIAIPRPGLSKMRVEDFSDDIINGGEEETLFTKSFASLRLVLTQAKAAVACFVIIIIYSLSISSFGCI